MTLILELSAPHITIVGKAYKKEKMSVVVSWRVNGECKASYGCIVVTSNMVTITKITGCNRAVTVHNLKQINDITKIGRFLPKREGGEL